MKSKRRRFISASAAGLALVAVDRLHASPDRAQAALRAITRGAAPEETRVELDIPPLVENGNLVVLNVRVQSPMTANDFVKTIYIVAEGNPLPNVITAHFTPRAGKAALSTRVRLSESQRVWAIAETNKGTFYSGQASTIVTLAACTEER